MLAHFLPKSGYRGHGRLVQLLARRDTDEDVANAAALGPRWAGYRRGLFLRAALFFEATGAAGFVRRHTPIPKVPTS